MYIDTVKRRYTEFRLGYPLLVPILSMSNFILLVYNFTDLKNIPFELFAGMFVIVGSVIVVLVGHTFRSHQQPTDLKLVYERNKEGAKTAILQLMTMQKLLPNDDPLQNDIEKRLTYLRGIIEK